MSGGKNGRWMRRGVRRQERKSSLSPQTIEGIRQDIIGWGWEIRERRLCATPSIACSISDHSPS
jgi:hypothetical protein